MALEDDSHVQEVGDACPACRGTGYNDETLRLYDSFHGRDGWGHALTQDEVNALAEAGRLWEFTHTYVPDSAAHWEWKEPRVIPAASEVNSWSWRGFGHDVINQRICSEVRAMRMGVYGLCAGCGGDGEQFH